VLLVGPSGRDTGGIARYLTEQRRRLPDEFDVRVHDNGVRSRDGDGALAAAALAVLATLRAWVGFPFRRRPDVVHVHTSDGVAFYRASWFVVVAAVIWGRPVVVHVHGSSFDEFVASASPLAAGAQWLTFGLADRVVSLSEHWREVLSARVADSKLVVVPNAVDPDEYDPDYGADPPAAVFVSNHVERKGIREFVAALDRLGETEPFDEADARVEIAGSGPLADLAADLADRAPNVTYRGYVSESEKRAMIESASLYVLPTYAEGLPIALLEGMAGGNAVLTTDVDAIPEVVDDDSGWVVEPGDVDGLTAALEDWTADPGAAAAMGRHNRAIVEERYTWPVVVDRLTDVYRSLA